MIFDTLQYRRAYTGAGPHAFTWRDKPHRLIFDLCSEIERLQLKLMSVGLSPQVPDEFSLGGWVEAVERMEQIHGEGHAD